MSVGSRELIKEQRGGAPVSTLRAVEFRLADAGAAANLDSRSAVALRVEPLTEASRL